MKFPIYSYRKTFFSFKIERNDVHGNQQVIASVPIEIDDAEAIASSIVKTLEKSKLHRTKQ